MGKVRAYAVLSKAFGSNRNQKDRVVFSIEMKKLNLTSAYELVRKNDGQYTIRVATVSRTDTGEINGVVDSIKKTIPGLVNALNEVARLQRKYRNNP